jgi:putative heme transporter
MPDQSDEGQRPGLRGRIRRATGPVTPGRLPVGRLPARGGRAGTDLSGVPSQGRGPASPLVDGVPRTLRVAAGWSWRVLVIAAAVALLVYLVGTFQMIVVAVLVALLLAVLMEPVSVWLRRVLHFPRALAALTAILLLVGVVVGLLVLAGRAIVEGFGALADRVGVAVQDGIDWLANGPLGIDEAQIQGYLDQITGQVQANSDRLVSGVVGVTSSVTSAATGAVIALFCLFFFLKEGRRIWHWFVRLAPVGVRDRINEAGIRGWMTLGGYARTQILVAFVDAVGIAAGAAILQIPLALPIGILVFLFSFIPIVGAFISGAVAVVVALVDQGLVTALIMLAIVLAVQQLEGNVLQPWLQGNAVSLHPVAILLAVTAGTGIAGILGALFAVPVVATINTVILYLYGHDKYPSLAHDMHRPGGPPGAVFESIASAYAHMADDDKGADQDGTGAAAPTGDDEERTGKAYRTDDGGSYAVDDGVTYPASRGSGAGDTDHRPEGPR